MRPQKRPRSIRMRLTLTYVVAMLVILTVYAGVVYISVRGSLSQTLDRQLRDDFMWPEGMMTEDKLRELLRSENKQIGGEGSPWLQVWWRENGEEHLLGTYEAKSNPIPEAAQLARDAADGKIRTLSEMIPPYRILTGKTKVGGISLVIQVAKSEGPMRKYLRDLLLVLLFGLPLAVAIAGLGGYSLARRALAPVDRMA